MKQAAPWLGLICQGQSFEEVEHWLEAAARHGFKTVQPTFFWSGYSETDFGKLKKVLEKLELNAPVFGVYCDLYKWDQAIGAVFESTVEDFKTAAKHASEIGARDLISWCGTAGDFAADCPQNRDEPVQRQFRENLNRLLPTCEQHGVRLLFEPWREHVLSDESSTAEACRLDAEHFAAVLDLPNFISPEQWLQRQSRIGHITDTLAPHIAVVHLKDMLVNAEGAVELPMFGRGELTEELAAAIRPYCGKLPVIAEHFSSAEDLPELLENVGRYFDRSR